MVRLDLATGMGFNVHTNQKVTDGLFCSRQRSHPMLFRAPLIQMGNPALCSHREASTVGHVVTRPRLPFTFVNIYVRQLGPLIITNISNGIPTTLLEAWTLSWHLS